jgi:hypothetical protein
LSTDVTPGRQTLLHLDLPSTVMVDGPWGGARHGGQISNLNAVALGRDSRQTEGVRFWPGAQAWTLQPLQEKSSWFQEKLPADVTLDDFLLGPEGPYTLVDEFNTAVGMMAVHSVWQGPFGNGMNATPGLLSTGDPIAMKAVPAGGGWNGIMSVQSIEPPQGSLFSAPNLAMDAVFAPEQDARADQGFYLRWVIPGSAVHYPDWVLNFYFGQYCLAVRGDGLMHLTEYCRPADFTAYRWQMRRTMRYARPSQVSNTTHNMLIFPVRGMLGQKYIVFSGNMVESNPLSIGSRTVPLMEETYEAEPLIRGFDADEAPGYVTKAGPYRIDVRRDIRVGWHLSKLVFSPAVGHIYDEPWHIHTGAYPRPFRIRLDYRVPDLLLPYPDLVHRALFDATTGAILDPDEAQPIGIEVDTEELNAPGVALRVTLTTQNVQDTPVFYGYDIRRDPKALAIEPGALVTTVRTYASEASGPTPDGDRAEVTLFDPADALSKLRTRGVMDAKVTVKAPWPTPSDPLVQVTVFKGQIQRPRRTRFGKPDQFEEYPSNEWSHYSLAIQGLAAKHREFVPARIDLEFFLRDSTAPDEPVLGDRPPWTVTRAIRKLLTFAGVDPLNIDIEENPIRIYPGSPLVDVMDLTEYEAKKDPIDMAVRLARLYLGAALVYDFSLGVVIDDEDRSDDGSTEGAWTLIYPSPADAGPVCHFVGEGLVSPLAGVVSPAAYPPGEDEVPVIFFTGPADSYVVAPECNHVHVYTVATGVVGTKGFNIHRHRYNPHSYEVYGSGVTPDPASPHYVGREKRIDMAAPELYDARAGDDRYHFARDACAFVADRLINYAGRGRIVQPVHGPLIIIADPVTGRLRTLRHQDPVTFRGEAGWFVRSVSADYDFDRMQMAHYELEYLVPL